MAQNVYRTPVANLPEFRNGRSRHFSGSVYRPASLLTGLREMMGHRPRSESLGGKNGEQKPLRKVQITGCQLSDVYDLREGDESNEVDLFEDLCAFRRPRCNSSDFLILRKTSRPLSVDVVGLVDAQSDPYRQYMKVVDCYELQPQHGNVILLDSKMKVDRAFHVLCEQNVGAGLIWDAEKSEVASVLTWSDFLVFLQTHHAPTSTLPIYSCASSNRLVKVDADTKYSLKYSLNFFRLFNVCEEFCSNRVHRIVVTEPGSGNVLYLLTLKRVLQAIHKQNRSLHFAQWLSCPIEESRLGFWGELTVVKENECLSEAVKKLLDYRLSSLPVIGSDGRARDLLYKDDIAKVMRNKKDIKTFFETVTVGEVLGERKVARFASPRDSIASVIDALLAQKHCRCMFMVDSEGKPRGCVSISDIVSHLLYSSPPFSRRHEPAPSSN